ncbi:Ribosomal protein L31E [Methanocella conradii HZ254]|uniref:Large ribosomal subunit protein eL31 n=1 Tax=Methanocella conradii (strain DSM 24694 / JCM 17849 / CGMCC 1.5162 / HZ254) TaxID=1041930 RepID=H8I466_METCZ|nr:50S ribosomal protein L31e [Methanocella conradii]AFC99205.1 Ribosomal protein L31E [Methanocella conradii HZ254]MDI6897795.1 50S ribosomal protein L31e [Methanocella conradii]
MAEEKTEQIYTIPLDTEGYPRWKKANLAVKLIRQYLSRHMKVEEDKIKINAPLNEAVWARGIRKPPRRIRVKATRVEDGVVEADVVGGE